MVLFESKDNTSVNMGEDDGNTFIKLRDSDDPVSSPVFLEGSKIKTSINEHYYLDGEDDLLCRQARASLLESLAGHHVPRTQQTFAEIQKESNDFDDEEAPDPEREDAIGPPLTFAAGQNIKQIHNKCGHPSQSEFLRALRLSRV